MPRTAVGAAAQQAASVAETLLQRAVSLYFLCRDVDDDDDADAVRLSRAESAVAQLAALVDEPTHQAQLYLALARVELFVAHQQRLKDKTKVSNVESTHQSN